MRKTAITAVPVHPLLAERWSPREFDRRRTTGSRGGSWSRGGRT